MTTSTIHLEIVVEVDHDLDIVNTIRIINTDFPKPISVDITDFLSIDEIEQAGLAALTELEYQSSKKDALLEDRNRE
jgi:hypothetical protein